MNIFYNLNTFTNNYESINLLISILELIIISVSIWIALSTYRRSKKKDSDSTAIDILSFFRSEIITESDKFRKHLRHEKGADYIIESLRLYDLDLKNLTEEQKKAIKRQMEIFHEDRALIAFYVLNSLEELSLKITYFKLQDSEILFSIRAPFVEIFETKGFYFLLARKFDEDNKSYSKTLELYNLWKNNIDRRTVKDLQKEIIKIIK